MSFRLSEGQGEAIYEIGISDDGIPVGLTDEEFEETFANLKKMAAELHADISILCEKVVEEKKSKEKKRVAEVLIRLFEDEKYLDLRLAVCGNVDSGKVF
jgi:GTPase